MDRWVGKRRRLLQDAALMMGRRGAQIEQVQGKVGRKIGKVSGSDGGSTEGEINGWSSVEEVNTTKSVKL